MLRKSVCFMALGGAQNSVMENMQSAINRMDQLEKELRRLRTFIAATPGGNFSLPGTDSSSLLDVATNFVDSETYERIYQYDALQPISPIKMQTFMAMETIDDLRRQAKLLKVEVAKRMAHRARDLTMAPFGLSHMPSILLLRQDYEHSYCDLRRLDDPETEAQLRQFAISLRNIFLRHVKTAALLSNGIRELGEKDRWAETPINNANFYTSLKTLDTFLDAFAATRAQQRFILSHHICCSRRILKLRWERFRGGLHLDHPRETFVGAICRECDMKKIVDAAVADAIEAMGSNRDLPPVNVRFVGDPVFRFTQAPLQIFNILSSMVHDALWLNVEGEELDFTPVSPVELLVSQSPKNSDCVVRVKDSVGRLPFSLRKIAVYSYVYNTRKFYENPLLTKEDRRRSVENGWRHSAIKVPYAAVAAKQMGGELFVTNAEGIGTERVLSLPAKDFLDVKM